MAKRSRRKGQSKERMPFVARTFQGLPQETDWIALREFVPSATAQVTLRDGREVRVCSLLPGSGAGIVRPDGEVWLGLQVIHNFGDISRDLAHVLELSAETEPGNAIVMTDPGVGPRLQEMIDPASAFAVEVHDGFDFWVEGQETEEIAELLAQTNEAVSPTVKLSGVESAYWTEMGTRRYLRWVLPYPEDDVLDALARLHAAGAHTLGGDTRLLGSFRAHGLLVPVWETEGDADSLETPTQEFSARFEEALTDAPLTSEQRSSRQGLANRQLTIR